MYCDKCPHDREIADALAPCQSCPRAHARECETCPHLEDIRRAMKPCSACEAGKLHGECHFDLTVATPNVHGAGAIPIWRKAIDRSPFTGCTALDIEDEDTMRMMIADIVSGIDYADLPAFVAALFKRDSSAFPPVEIEKVRGVLKAAGERIFRNKTNGGDAVRLAARLRHWVRKIVTGETHRRRDGKSAPILLGLLKGEKFADVARAIGMNSRQVAHSRFKAMLEDAPELAALNKWGTDLT